jgi:hypothetical protein
MNAKLVNNPVPSDNSIGVIVILLNKEGFPTELKTLAVLPLFHFQHPVKNNIRNFDLLH